MTTQVIRSKFENLFRKYENPAVAAGMCYIASEQIYGFFNSHEGNLRVIYAEHHNNPAYRYHDLGQYSNHYAIYSPEEKLVIDYTMRQFAPESEFPFIGTKRQWHKLLCKAWGVPNVRHLSRNLGFICYDCGYVHSNSWSCT